MNGERFSHRDTDTDRLRTVIAAIDRDLGVRAATRCGNCWNTLQPCS
jgi:hypothetical protein